MGFVSISLWGFPRYNRILFSPHALFAPPHSEPYFALQIEFTGEAEAMFFDDGTGKGSAYETSLSTELTISFETDSGGATLTQTKTAVIDVDSSDWKNGCGFSSASCIVFQNSAVTLYAPESSGSRGLMVINLTVVFQDVVIVSIDSTGICMMQTTCITIGIIVQFGLVVDDPHVTGLLGQKFDWYGEDGGWYAFLSAEQLRMNMRVNSYLPETFPERQLITGVALITEGGHSVTIEVKDPLDLEPSCPAAEGKEGWRPCLAGGALRVTVDGNDVVQHPGSFSFVNGVEVTAINLPLECQRFGDHGMWVSMPDAQKLATPNSRSLRAISVVSLVDWLLQDSIMIAPPWCEKFLLETGGDYGQLEQVDSRHAVFRVQLPNLSVRVNVGINNEAAQELPDGRIVPEASFWQMDVRVEDATAGLHTAKGMLGETARPVLDASGKPVMYGLGVLRGAVEDYRVIHPLGTEFRQLFVPEE